MKAKANLFLTVIVVIAVTISIFNPIRLNIINAEEDVIKAEGKVEEKAEEDEGVMRLTLEEAVELGLKNSISLKQVENEINLSAVAKKRAHYLSDKLKDADETISEGWSKINSAENYIDSGIAPQDIQLPDGTVIPEGTNINELPLDSETKEQIINEIKQNIADQKENLLNGELTLIDSLQEAGSTLSDKLNFESLDSLSLDSTADLMEAMADISYEVTSASYGIYKNKIALLIQNSYYNVIKAEKLLEAKKKAMERAKKQFQFAKDGFEEGMKSKDEMLLAGLYYKGAQIEYQKAEGELKNALIELKKDLNIPLDKEVVLEYVLADNIEEVSLEEGLKSGLKNRLEIKKALGEVAVYDLNFELTKRKYPPNTFQYKEASLLKEKARLNYEKTRLEVESSIRQSYETLKAAGEMLKTSKEMVDEAKENLEIAEFKYKEGFGVETTFLKKLDIESAAGTIVEVLAAEENLADVEEKVVNIMYGYNLAKMKYFNDIGKLIY